MTDDPLGQLERLSDATEEPDAAFAERLFAELLSQLSADSDAVASLESASADALAPDSFSSDSILQLKEHDDMETSAKKWLWPLVGAAAAGVLLVAGLAFASRDDDPGTADQLPATLPAEAATADQGDEGAAQVASAAALVTAINESDADTVAGLLHEDASLQMLSATTRDEFLQLVDYFPTDGTHFAIEACERGDVYTVTCTAEFTNIWSEAVGADRIGASFHFRFDDGQISVVRHGLDMGVMGRQVWGPWFAFIEAEHPDDIDRMFVHDRVGQGMIGPQLTAESFALHEKYSAEFAATYPSE